MSEGQPAARLLGGIRVLDLSHFMSGPFCTAMLADLGAEVIKIEPPAGDPARGIGPFRDGHSAYFAMLNRGKKSVILDLKTPPGKAALTALVTGSDVLVENFRPGVMARLGFDAGAAQKINPGLVYASISGFGQMGPMRGWPAFDLMIQAMGGLMSLTGPEGGPPTAVGESVADVATGMFAAFGIVAALFERARGGAGRYLDIAMLDSVMAMQLTGLSRQLYTGETPVPAGNSHPVTYPVDCFDTGSGKLVLVCPSDSVFAALAGVMAAPGLAADRRFADPAARHENRSALRATIAAWMAGRDRDEAVATLLAAGVPAAPVQDLAQLVHSDHCRARGVITQGRHPDLAAAPLVRQPVRFSGPMPAIPDTIPAPGADTAAVLSGLPLPPQPDDKTEYR